MLVQQGFQKVHTGRSSVLTKYEPVGTHDDPVYNSFCVSVGDPVGLNPVKNLVFYSLFGAGRAAALIH